MWQQLHGCQSSQRQYEKLLCYASRQGSLAGQLHLEFFKLFVYVLIYFENTNGVAIIHLLCASFKYLIFCYFFVCYNKWEHHPKEINFAHYFVKILLLLKPPSGN